MRRTSVITQKILRYETNMLEYRIDIGTHIRMLNHRYISMCTALPDGKIVGTLKRDHNAYLIDL